MLGFTYAFGVFISALVVLTKEDPRQQLIGVGLLMAFLILYHLNKLGETK